MRVPSFVLLLSLPLGAAALMGGREAVRQPQPVVAAGSVLTELQRAVGSGATVAAASGTAGKRQELVFGKVPTAATETKAGVRVALSSGKPLQLKNVPAREDDEVSAVTYRYKGFEAKTGLVWMTKTGWEYEYQLLVNRQNGRVTKVANEPHLNTTATLLFARQNDCFAIFEDANCYPGFELWRLQAGQLQLLKKVRLNGYFVLDGRWLAPNKLRLELGSIEQLMNGGVDKVRRLPFELTVHE